MTYRFSGTAVSIFGGYKAIDLLFIAGTSGHHPRPTSQRVSCILTKVSFPDALWQTFGFQAVSRSTIQTEITSLRPMSSITASDPDIREIVSYWFDGPESQENWFGGGPQVDTEIKERFGGLVEKARAEELNSWTTEPTGTLALILLLDQFPRNIFRGNPSSFSSDAQAMKITTMAIAKGFDRQVPHLQQPFYYLPLMHNETLLSQIACIALFESALCRCESDSEVTANLKKFIKFSYSHQDPIKRFGRFPSRNETLGRESTPEEIAYRKENPSGF